MALHDILDQIKLDVNASLKQPTPVSSSTKDEETKEPQAASDGTASASLTEQEETKEKESFER